MKSASKKKANCLAADLSTLRAHHAYRLAHPTDFEIWISAIRNGDLHLIKHLSAQNFDVKSRGRCDVTGLMYAAEIGNYEVVKFLLKRRAYVNARDDMSYTALFYAVMHEHPEVVRLLLEWGANPDARDLVGWTALDHLRLFSEPSGLSDEEFQMAQLLVEFGATVNP